MRKPFVSRAWAVVRASDWWAYKIPPLLAIAYAGFIVFEQGPRAWANVGAALLCILLVASYGYMLNDICDVEADHRSGRPNRMTHVGPGLRAVGLLAPFAGAIGLCWAIGDSVMLGLLGLNLLLPTLYSLEPVRLKGRGLWGALADAGGVHAVPAAFVARAVTLQAEGSGSLATVFVASSVGWSLLSGLRGIVIHQIADRGADQRAGVLTLGAALGVERSRRLVLRGLLPAEVICLALFLLAVLPFAPPATVMVALFVFLEFVKVGRGWTLPTFELPDVSRERYIPLINNDLYEVWLPLGLAVQLALMRPWLWLLVLAQVLLFLPNSRARLDDALRSLRPTRKGLMEMRIRIRAGLGRVVAGVRTAPEFRVIIGATTWTVNGVNVFSANLARGLVEAGVPTEVLLTEQETDLIQTHEKWMPRPTGVPFTSLPIARTKGWGAHWGGMIRYLKEAAPCIYIPNSDWRHSCVCPRLPDDVVVVGVVHSDDPLHYDHVQRLGVYWNAMTAVSGAVAQRTIEMCPSVADRIVAIPIGVQVPARRPPRPPRSGPLRLVYHGILKQHQKRVLDFPAIVEAALLAGVPVEMSIVGAGPDEDALRAACQSLVDRGVIHFLGVVSPDDTAAILEEHDVYLLTSEFEGMPNALIEAMGRGCVPVVTRMTSGIPELIRDGENGFMVPIGDAAAFAERLGVLGSDPARRERMSAAAFQTVHAGRFRVEDMVASYRRVFARAWNDARTGRFVRPQGPISPPPPQVAGISLFPVPLPHLEPDLGAFPSVDDAADYFDQVRTGPRETAVKPGAAEERIREAASRILLDGVKVFVSAPVWTINGVNVWAEDLARGLRHVGLDARLLLTEEATDLVCIEGPRISRPSDVPMDELRVSGQDTWGARWGAMLRMLEDAAPCVYFPSYDWRHSCIVPRLSNQVTVIGSLPVADGDYTEHAQRLGHCWNAVVALDRSVELHVRKRLPHLDDRLLTIPHGFNAPVELTPRPVDPEGLSTVLVVTAGLESEALLVWIKTLARQLSRAGSGFRVVLLDPPQSLRDSLAETGARVVLHASRQDWSELCRNSRFVVANTLLGDGKRLVVEAMGHGCIPVLPEAGLGDEYLVRDRDSGVVVPDDRAETAVARMIELVPNAALLGEMAARAHAAARRAGFCMDAMVEAYLELIRREMAKVAVGEFRRRRGPILPPPASVDGASIFPVELRHRTGFGRFQSPEDALRYREEYGPGRGPFGWNRW